MKDFFINFDFFKLVSEVYKIAMFSNCLSLFIIAQNCQKAILQRAQAQDWFDQRKEKKGKRKSYHYNKI